MGKNRPAGMKDKNKRKLHGGRETSQKKKPSMGADRKNNGQPRKSQGKKWAKQTTPQTVKSSSKRGKKAKIGVRVVGKRGT